MVSRCFGAYTGDVHVYIFPCLGHRLGDDDYDGNNSKFRVIGLTKDVIVVMETKDIDIMV
jgi:hypothetical protein